MDFERISMNERHSLLRPVSLKEAGPTNREFINQKETKPIEEGVNTFKGHKVIQIEDDVEGICLNKISLQRF